MLTRKELKSELRIDVHALDDACARQPELFLEASEQFSEAKAAAKAAKHNLELTLGSVELDIRSGKIDSGGIKLTGDSVLAMVASNSKVVEAKKDLVEAERESFLWGSLVDAFDQRRTMLSNECSLHVTEYYQTGPIKATEAEIVAKRKQR